jgi:hypothetical protein
MTAHWTDRLTELDACTEAVTWARDYDTPAAAWAACERGDWMLWLAGRLAEPSRSDARRPLVLAACACARLALPYVFHDEPRPLAAIELAEQWARGGNVTLRDLRSAADAAYAAAYAAAAAAAADAYAAVSRSTLRACADIVRQHYPDPPNLEVTR